MSLQSVLFRAFVMLALSSSAAHATAPDFVFGDDYESAIPCPAGPTPAIAGAMSPSGRSTRLGTNNYFFVKILSCGYAGSVNFVPSGAPASWSLTVDPPSVSIASGGWAVALVNAAIPTDGDSGFVTIDVSAVALSNSVPLSANVDAANEFLLVIRDGTGSDPAQHPFPQTLHLRVGTKYRIYNADSTAYHLIHADTVPGYMHQSTAGPGLALGEEYDLTASAPGSGHVYCHSHGYGAFNPAVIVQ